MLAPRPLAQRPLVRRRQVGLVGPARRRSAAPRRSAPPGSRPAPPAGHAERRRARRRPARATAASIPARVSRSTAITSRWSVDEAQLGVERGVLGQVPDGVVRLGPEHRPHLVDPLEDADHHLLVELRRLGQVGRAGRSSRARRRSPRTRWPSRRSSGCGSRRSRAASSAGPEAGRPPPPRSATPPTRVGCRSATGGVVELGGQARGQRRAGTGRTAAVRPAAPSSRTVGSVELDPGRARRGWRPPCRPPRRRSPRSAPRRWARAAGSVTTTWARPGGVPDDQEGHRLEQPAAVDPAGDRARSRRRGRGAGWTGCVAWRYLLGDRNAIPREVWASGILAVPPHLRPRRAGASSSPVTGASRRALLGVGGSAVLPAAREGLRAPAPGRLHSYRRLSRLAGRGATRLRRRCCRGR